MKNNIIEAEGQELILQNSFGDHVIIPKNRREYVLSKINEGCNECIDSLVDTLPVMSEYAQDGTIIPRLYKQRTGITLKRKIV